MHHAEHRRALVQQRDQRAPDREPGDEGFRAVDRIEHPDIVGVLALIAEFLADDAVLGKVIFDDPPHHRFRGAIGLGDGIEILRGTLVVDRQRRAEERQDGFARRRGEAADEGGEVDDRHVSSLKECAWSARFAKNPDVLRILILPHPHADRRCAHWHFEYDSVAARWCIFG